jgi:phospholipase/carboxylesterase
MGPYGYQWFSLQDRTPLVMAAGADRAAPVLMAFIQQELAARGLEAGRLALVGFSQGTMMALHVGPRLSPGPAAIVGFSGALLGPDRLVAEARATPPILLIHGEADQVVPFPAMAAAVRGLADAGIAADSLRRPGLGHGIDEPGLARAGQFLAKYLSGVPSQV